MSRKNRKPSWWPLFALLPLTMGALLLESRTTLPVWGHRVAQIGIVVLFFVLAGLLVRMNEGVLMWDEVRSADSKTSRIIYVREPQPPVENEAGDSSSAGDANTPSLDQYLSTLPLPDELYLLQHLRASPGNAPIALGEERNN
jgi:hypothetical protein